jgi:hypothetical protein
LKRDRIRRKSCSDTRRRRNPGKKVRPLRFVYTRDLDLEILLSDAISIEILPSFQIATAGDRDNIQCFLACVNTTLESNESFSFQ